MRDARAVRRPRRPVLADAARDVARYVARAGRALGSAARDVARYVAAGS